MLLILVGRLPEVIILEEHLVDHVPLPTVALS
jgi:hypothetical protein